MRAASSRRVEPGVERSKSCQRPVFLFQHNGQVYTRKNRSCCCSERAYRETVQVDADERHRSRCGRGSTRTTATPTGSAEATASQPPHEVTGQNGRGGEATTGDGWREKEARSEAPPSGRSEKKRKRKRETVKIETPHFEQPTFRDKLKEGEHDRGPWRAGAAG